MKFVMRSGRRGLVAAAVASGAVLVLIGLAVAASGGGDDGNDQAVAATATASVPGSTATPPTVATATVRVPTATASPDSPVSSTPAVPGNPTPSSPGSSTLPASNLPSLLAGTHRVEAPIDGLEVLTLESAPPQHLLHVTAGLPSGCARQAGYEASRTGPTVTVKVYNSMPVGALICTQIYGIYELNINLGSDYQPGQTYTVRVNNKTVSFTAQ